jgi:hypothetical protein
MENQQDKTQLIKNCAISFFCVCQQQMTKEQLVDWARRDTNPNDYMDANVLLDQVMVNHGIDTFNEDGEISDEIADLFNAIFDQANELAVKAYKPIYTLEDLHHSINDIFEQFDEGKMTRNMATMMTWQCCNQFVKDNNK